MQECKDIKRVGFVIVNLTGGGAERVVLNLAKMFQKRGVDVHLFLLENVISYQVDLTIVHCLNERHKKNKFFKEHGVRTLGKKLKNMIQEIENDGLKFDVLFSNLPAADAVVSTLDLNRKVFYLIHTAYTFEIEEMKARREYLRVYRRSIFYRKLYKGKNLIAVSKGVADDLDQFRIAYASNYIVYNPFDMEYIREMGNEQPLDLPDEAYMVVVSAHRKEKRLDIALQAYASLIDPPKLKLLCKKDEKLLKMIRELGLEKRVDVLGFKKNPYPYIKHAQLLILSSEREGLPTVLVESLILNTPVVSTDCISGPREIMTGELQEYLAKVNDSKSLAEKVSLALCRYPDINEKMLEKFKEENVYNEYCRVIKGNWKR